MRRYSRQLLWALAAISAAVWPFMPAWTLVRGAALLLPFFVLGMEWARAGSGVTGCVESLWPFLGVGMLVVSFVVALSLNGGLWVGSAVPWRLAWVPLLGTAAGLLACVGWLGAIRRLRGRAVAVLARLGAASMGVYGVHGITLSALSGVLVPQSLASALALAAVLIPLSFGVTRLLALNPWTRTLFLGGRGATLGTPPRKRTTSNRVGGKALRASFWVACAAAAAIVALGGSSCVQGPAEQTASGATSVPTTTSSVATASVSASAAPSGDSAAAHEQRINVWMRPKTALRGGRLHVSSATSLMDGSVVQWEVGRNSSPGQWDVHQSGTATVADGSFRFSADVKTVPGRKLYVFLMFSTRSQTKAVIERYGDTGQYVQGDHLAGHGSYRTIEYWVGVSR